jgi:DNA-binding transcriptional regulator YiaG
MESVKRQMKFPDRLRAWRKKKKLTQEKAAQVLGVPVGTFRDWEQGRYEPVDALKMEALAARMK